MTDCCCPTLRDALKRAFAGQPPAFCPQHAPDGGAHADEFGLNDNTELRRAIGRALADPPSADPPSAA